MNQQPTSVVYSPLVRMMRKRQLRGVGIWSGETDQGVRAGGIISNLSRSLDVIWEIRE